MNSEAPVNAGHYFANAAEDYEENEQWLKAAEAHSKAAEQFEIALKDTGDAEATRTLRLLTSNHTRKANELNRKAQRLIKSAANQRMHQMVGSNSNMKSTSSIGLRHALPDRQQQQQQQGALLVSRLANGKGDFSIDEGSHHRTSEIGESYALLTSDNDDDDPFNKFLEAVEGLVQQLFNPAVAFTSAPLNENDNPIPIMNTPVDEMTESKSVATPIQPTTNMIESYYMVPSPDGSDDPNNYQQLLNKTAALSLGETVVEKSIQQRGEKEDYKAENERLRAQIAQLTKRMKSLEMTAEEGNMLKSSVLQFRNDVHKQAKRIMQSHHESSMRSSAAALLGPGGGGGGGGGSVIGNSSIRYPTLAAAAAGSGSIGGHDLISRLKELEAENKQLKAQNEKQNVLVNRYRERWEMLKENAKKRRAPSSTVSTPITEENEN